ncbi:hypothetical protein DOY81_011706 [Sarcophaga bullata]|nr:hypothetical protein DOY81_011706 [Sarcophaga bullata]
MSLTDDENHCTDFQEVNINNFKQIKNKAIKIGYADGVNDGREIFQKGFDQGYKDGLRTQFSTLDQFRYLLLKFKHLIN